MDPAQKAALKELLHLLVDKEEPAVLADLLSKLPVGYQALAMAIAAAAMPTAQAAQDKLVDKI